MSGPIIDRLAADARPTDRATIGRAIDYRIRYHFASLLSRDRWVEDEWDGDIHGELWPARQADGTSTVWRVRDSRTERLEQRSDLIAWRGAACVIRSDDPWEDAHWRSRIRDIGVIEESRLSRACVAGFFDALDDTVGEIAPHHRCPTDAEERALARLCIMLAAFEVVVRPPGPAAWPPRFLGDGPPENAAELLTLVPDDWVEDAATLGAAFSERYASWRGADAVLNPTFAGSLDVGGADADLIADGCLWEIKTTKKSGAEGKWLHQLLGYALLDYENEYAIDRVGLLLPRQNTRVSWPIGEVIAAMSDREDLALPELRREFRTVCEGVREERDERREERRERIAAALRLKLR